MEGQMGNYSWTCPFCNRITTITSNDESSHSDYMQAFSDQKYYVFQTHAIKCPNPECQKLSITAKLVIAEFNPDGSDDVCEELENWTLRPSSKAKPMPEYIPKSIRIDYEEACKIVNLSPKASATLSRRCIQGMIRDFWGIQKDRLIDEINAIQKIVDSNTWKAIDSIRKIGNIGAHMEKYIDLIIDVDQKEAEALISLIEFLMKEWYVSRKESNDLLADIVMISDQKDAMKKKE
jgi:hypothetical protein